MPRNELSPFEKKARHEIAKNLKKYMHGMTQSDLADKANIPLTTLSGYIREKSTPNAENLGKLAKALHVKQSNIDPRYTFLKNCITTTANGYSIFEKINFLAQKRGITIRQVAIDSGFKSPNAIYRYKQGVTPRFASIEAIAKALSTSSSFLRGETDDWHLPFEVAELEDVKANDEAEAKVLTMFRKSTEGMNEDKKLRFQQSLEKLINAAKDLNNPKE